MLKFKKVEANNYKSFREFSLDLQDKGLILIEGDNLANDSFDSNGSGKSSLLEAISYAIYDIGALSIKADEVVNRKEGKDTFVKLFFEQNGVSYRIERYRKHKEHKNKVKLYQSGKEITASTNRATNELIEDIIGVSIETYMNSIMYGQGTEPLFSEATDKGKKEILENITSISIYAKAQEIAKEKVKQQELDEVDIARDLENNSDKIVSIKESVEREVERYESIKNMISTRELELEEAKKERKQFPQANLRKLKKDLEGLGAPMPDFIPNNAPTNKAREELTSVEGQAQEFQQAINQIKGSVSSKRNEQAKLDTTDVCPTCGTKLSNEHAKKHHQELQTEIDNLEASVNGYSEQYELSFVPLIQEATDKLRAAEVDLETNRREYDEARHERSMEEQQLQGQIETFERNKEQLVADVERAKKSLEEVKSLPKPDLREKEIKEVEKLNKDLEDTRNEVFIAKSQYEDAVKAFSNSGIRSVVLDLVTPTLTNSANKYLNILSESTLKVEFTTQIENADGKLADRFDVRVIHNGEETTFQTLSQGEKTRVNVAISLALQDLVYSNNQLKTNIALYDEVFDGLDDKGISSVIDILKDKAKEIGSVFVITHSNTMKPLFEKVITIEKSSGISEIKGE